MWVWQQVDWPKFYWNEDIILPLVRKVRLKQGLLFGKSEGLTEHNRAPLSLDTMLENIITSSAIEGEALNANSVRSSLAKRLVPALNPKTKTSVRSEGVAEIFSELFEVEHISLELLCDWHKKLFPKTEFSLYEVNAGGLRGIEPMQVVSGQEGRYTIHYEAPPREVLAFELEQFIEWFNTSHVKASKLDPLLRAGICHFWFVTLHPFEDGNGRLTRYLTDLALHQDNPQALYCYAMSASILKNRKGYYEILESSQKSGLEITPWLHWFLVTLLDAIENTMTTVDRLLSKTKFWQCFQSMITNKEQIYVLNKMFDEGNVGFPDGIGAAKYQKIAKVSKATATRHLAELTDKGCLVKLPGSGRSTRYDLHHVYTQ